MNPNVEYLARMAKLEREERQRIAAVLERGARHVDAGPGIHPCAPARGTTQIFRHEEVMRTEGGNFRIRRTTGPGAHALRMSDAFDVMEVKAAAAAKSRGRDYQPLFTPAQVAAGRAFAEVSEAVSKVGVKCSSLEGIGGGDGGFMDAYMGACQRLDRMRAAIGDGWALLPREAAPHRGDRQPIRARAVVYFVCVGGQTMADVLRRFGWSRGQKAKMRLRASLATSLDALHGI